MTLTSAETIAAAQELGVERVVLARELSLDEIRRDSRRDDHAAGGVRSRSAVRGLFRAMSDQRIAGRPQRQSRPVCPGVPTAV